MKLKFFKSAYILILAVIILLGINACSTQKNTFPNRAYHTVTSKFNVNFNAKEALKTGEAELAKKQVDNYTAILPVYNYPAKTDIVAIYPQMDRAIEKCSKSIFKHSMMIRGQEYVKTMDDVYLIMGKAYFHKQEYSQAQRIFSYIENNYKGKKWNAREEAMILEARTALRQEYYSQAQTLLDEAQLELHNNKSKKLKVQYNAAVAEYQLTAPDGDIESAIDYIQEAIANKPKRAFKTRLYFILGQLYELNGRMAEAEKSFRKVIQRTPEYEMEFNAYMHLATNYDGTEASRNAIIKDLHKMLEEGKNENYRDQIYFALYKIAKIDEDEEAQIDNLALSVASYVNNDYQRTYSSITLADIYFENEQYINAQAYYDTAMLSLPNNYPNRESIVKKSNVLRDLVDNLNVISVQDSLQRIAKMTDAQRSSWVNKMIAKYTEEERRIAQEEANRMLVMQSTSHMQNINPTNTSNGKWYFYNSSLVTAGKTDFFRNWGNRRLEDNWRISNKQQISFDDLAVINDPSLARDTTEYDEDGNPIKVRETDPKKPEYYTQDLPLTPEAMDSSNRMIADALYNSAIIYLDLLNDQRRATETFEKLVSRFPDDPMTLPSLYMLYRTYSQVNNPKSEVHKNTILTKYPDTDYARLILDPDYYKKLAEKEKTLEIKYEEAYHTYSTRQWKRTIELVNESLPQVEDPILGSKFEYLRAVAIGQTLGEDSLKNSLTRIILKYPGTPVADLAKVYLSTFDDADDILIAAGDPAAIAKNTQVPSLVNPFVYKPDEMHYTIVIVDVAKIPVLEVKENINRFNLDFYSLQKFNLNNFYINANQQMITVAKFNNKTTALDYYNHIIRDETFAPLIANGTLIVYPISATNYTTYYNKISERVLYQEFFEDHYLK